jgi:hypothetical protein
VVHPAAGGHPPEQLAERSPEVVGLRAGRVREAREGRATEDYRMPTRTGRGFKVSIEPIYIDGTHASVTAREVKTEAALHRADLDSHIADLEFAAAGIRRLLERLADGGSSDDVELRALWMASIVAYGRSFSGGRRPPLDDTVVPEPYRVVHQSMVDDRDLVIAHAISAEERLAVGVLLGPDGELPASGMPDLAILHIGPLMASIPTIRAYLSLAAQVAVKVRQLAREAGLRVASELARLSDEERRALPELELDPPTGDHGVAPARRRKRLRSPRR